MLARPPSASTGWAARTGDLLGRDAQALTRCRRYCATVTLELPGFESVRPRSTKCPCVYIAGIHGDVAPDARSS